MCQWHGHRIPWLSSSSPWLHAQGNPQGDLHVWFLCMRCSSLSAHPQASGWWISYQMWDGKSGPLLLAVLQSNRLQLIPPLPPPPPPPSRGMGKQLDALLHLDRVRIWPRNPEMYSASIPCSQIWWVCLVWIVCSCAARSKAPLTHRCSDFEFGQLWSKSETSHSCVKAMVSLWLILSPTSRCALSLTCKYRSISSKRFLDIADWTGGGSMKMAASSNSVSSSSIDTTWWTVKVPGQSK